MAFLFDKHFTLAEANALLPSVKEVFLHIHALADPASHKSSSESHTIPATNGNGHNGTGAKDKALVQYVTMHPTQRLENIKKLLSGLQEAGIVIQDVSRGLIDFPSIREGREVFLCYQLADGDTISHFHEIDAGFAGREPL